MELNFLRPNHQECRFSATLSQRPLGSSRRGVSPDHNAQGVQTGYAVELGQVSFLSF
jgi:hypothetical protein